MSTVNSNYSSSSRITGMFSSLDTDTLVKEMCATQQLRIDTKVQRKTSYEWQNEAVTQVMDAVKEFSNTYLSVLGSASMLKSSTYSSYSVSPTGGDSSAVTITASSTAEAGAIQVGVRQLAMNANVSSAGKVSANGTSISPSNTTTLGNLALANKLQFDRDGEISFSINGKAFTFNKNTTLQTMINTINNDPDANVTMKYSRLSDTFTISADSGGKDSKVSVQNIMGNAFGEGGAFGIATGTVKNGRNSISEINGALVERDSNTFSADGITYTLNRVTNTSSQSSIIVKQLAAQSSVASWGRVSADGQELSSDNTAMLKDLSFAKPLVFDESGQLSFAINGKTFTFSEDTSLQTMLDTINNDPDANVTMQYSRLKDAFTITADSGGADSRVLISNLSGNAFGADGAFQISTGLVQNGRNSIAVIEGVEIERSSNSYAIDGVDYELTEVTDQSDSYVTFSVTQDYSTTVSSVENFVKALNDLITKLNGYVTAKDYSSDYPPLTEAQKAAMTDEQIEKWEEKAKSGILRRDSDLTQLISNLKNIFFSSAGGTGKTATAVGISGASYYSSDKGLLVLDAEKLTAALKANPQEVIDLFTAGSSSTSKAQKGLIYQVRDALSAYQRTASASISSVEDKMDAIDTEVSDMEDRLAALAEKYYSKFAAMETAMSKLNAQASYISQLFV